MITIDGKVYRGLEEQVQYLTAQNSEKDKRLNLKLDKETVEGSALYGVQGTEQLMITAGDNITIANGKISAVGGGGGTSAGIDKLTSVNLTYGEGTTIQYDTAEGVQMSSTGHFVYDGGYKDATVELDIPLKAGSGISMDKAASGEYLEIKSTNGSVEVLLEAPQGATQGTVTDEQLATLLASDNNYIKYANEVYKLDNPQHIEGFLGYTHNGYENSQAWQKTITITISTLAWVLTVTPIQHKLTAGNNITISNDFVISASGGGGTSGVTDVKVNGTSVVTSGVANIDLTPYAKETELGAKQDALTAGQNVFIENNVISATNTVTTIDGVAGTITLGDGLSMSGTTLSATGGGGSGGKYMHLMAGSNSATYRIIWINDSSTILNSQALVTELTNAGYNKATKPWPLVIGAYNGYQLYNVHVDTLTDDLIFTIADGGTAPELGSTSTMKDIVIPL